MGTKNLKFGKVDCAFTCCPAGVIIEQLARFCSHPSQMTICRMQCFLRLIQQWVGSGFDQSRIFLFCNLNLFLKHITAVSSSNERQGVLLIGLCEPSYNQ